MEMASMRRPLLWTIGSGVLLLLSHSVATASTPEALSPDNLSPLLLISFLLPAGLILLSAAALTEAHAVEAVAGGVISWGIASLAYFAVGFAFQFGGIAIVHNVPELADLYWEYSPLDVTWGSGWGVIGLRGFLMTGSAATPGALTLLLTQLPLLGVATLIAYFATWEPSRRWLALPIGLLMGSVVYPLLGNWIWGGGWLANLGLTMAYGHGLVDANGSGQVALNGAAAALAVTLAFRRRHGNVTSEHRLDVPMPHAHLPLLGWSGALLMAIGWMATAALAHFPPAVNTVPSVIAANLVLAAFGAVFTAGLYTWFVSGQLNALMVSRALVAGLVTAAAGAPFLPAWCALVVGLVSGLLLPWLMFLFEHRWQMGHAAPALAVFGLPAILGLLWPGLLADGRYGIGWNRVAPDTYMGISGQGVSGVWVAAGFVPDWPGQLLAQVIGIAAIFIWSFGAFWVPLRILREIAYAWRRSGIEFGTPPPPAGFEEEYPPPIAKEVPVADAAVGDGEVERTDVLANTESGH